MPKKITSPKALMVIDKLRFNSKKHDDVVKEYHALNAELDGYLKEEFGDDIAAINVTDKQIRTKSEQAEIDKGNPLAAILRSFTQL